MPIAQGDTYEDEIAAKAQHWADAERRRIEADRAYTRAADDAAKAFAESQRSAEILSECVGQNIQQRIVIVADGSVVVIQYKRGVQLLEPIRALRR